jgi:hypothetical protein
MNDEELDGPVVSAIAEVKQRRSVISSHQSALGPRGGLWPVLLMDQT